VHYGNIANNNLAAVTRSFAPIGAVPEGTPDISVEQPGPGFELGVGYCFTSYLSAELEYVFYTEGATSHVSGTVLFKGKAQSYGGNLDTTIEGGSLSLVAYSPALKGWQLFARGGFFYGHTSTALNYAVGDDVFTAAFIASTYSTHETRPLLGAGLAYIGSDAVKLRLEYRTFNAGNAETGRSRNRSLNLGAVFMLGS